MQEYSTEVKHRRAAGLLDLCAAAGLVVAMALPGTALAQGRMNPADVEALVKEEYRGIRPAPGYPSQPDHTEKGTLFELLDATASIGVELTESFAMWPGSSVSGLYFAHPDAKYFGVGRIDRDQVEAYADRADLSLEETERSREDSSEPPAPGAGMAL